MQRLPDRLTETRQWFGERRETLSPFYLAALLLGGLVAVLVVAPLFWLVLRAGTVEPTRAIELVTSRRTVMIGARSIALVLGTTVASVLLGVPLAVLTTRTDLPAQRLFSVVIALPLVIPSYIGAFAFVSAFGRHGEVGSLLGLNLPQIDGFAGAVLVITLYTYPYVFLGTRAALRSMDASLVEAARSLDAGPIQAFRRVTLPQIRPAISAGALLVALYALSDFGTPAFMGVSVFTSAIYMESEAFNVGYAALLSLQLLTLAGVILLIESRTGRASGQTARRRGSPIELGWLRYPAMGLVGLLGAVTILLPVGLFLSWMVRGTGGAVPSLAFQPQHALNSIGFSLAAALVASVMALPVAYLGVSGRSRLGRLLERGTYVGFAVPGVVIGLALVFLGSSTAPWLYRTAPLLVFAYVVRFLPQAVGTTRSALEGFDDQVAEAARTLNAGPWRTFREVVLPEIAPGVLAGAALVFLTTMKELPATLMLQPIGRDTLATMIWAAHGSLYYRYAAVPALVLIVVSGVSMLVLLAQDESGI
ncbi:iron ABC transporter permease [Halodesulfurarchaeum sp. HSR-GB]|uniref:ABC transporter permease n=1 Tax=Halodesulfurarchaeum sp. HSR-GB TaxID=3074077 RepID=UPI00285C95E4|nr:iron ABC transporter permease [Halodesulfurarchaeum sp. HSR-GB]MDR5656036.1 iron ABC transporter permease [Halodesulfurarchaeum sp. HSR-GB]